MADQLFLERFIWFDGQVRCGAYPNASKLAEQFEIVVKSAQRAIDWFRDRLQAPLEYCKTNRGYYYSDPDFKFPVARLSEQEITALLISRKLLTDAAAGPLSEELSSVAGKLGSLLLSRLPGKVKPDAALSFQWNGFSPSSSLHFTQVCTAILQSRVLSLCYYSPNSRACTMRDVEPHHLVNYMGTWHLIAYCRLRKGWRDFVLSRMDLCQIREEEFTPRPESEWRENLDATFGIYRNEERFDVKLRFSPERALWVREQLWHRDQKSETLEDGSLLLTLPASHPAEIQMEILRHGAHVEVLDPPWLRERVISEAREMVRLYAA